MKTTLSGRDKSVQISPELPVVIIGERINPTGKKKLTKAIENGDMAIEDFMLEWSRLTETVKGLKTGKGPGLPGKGEGEDLIQDVMTLANPIEQMVDAFVGATSSIQALAMIMDPLSTIMQGFLQIVEGPLNSALAPLVGQLIALGNTLGHVLTPFIKVTGMALKLMASGFVWFYNNAILPVGNTFIYLGNLLYNFGKLIDNIIHFRWANLDRGFVDAFSEGMMDAIDLADLSGVMDDEIDIRRGFLDALKLEQDVLRDMWERNLIGTSDFIDQMSDLNAQAGAINAGATPVVGSNTTIIIEGDVLGMEDLGVKIYDALDAAESVARIPV